MHFVPYCYCVMMMMMMTFDGLEAARTILVGEPPMHVPRNREYISLSLIIHTVHVCCIISEIINFR